MSKAEPGLRVGVGVGVIVEGSEGLGWTENSVTDVVDVTRVARVNNRHIKESSCSNKSSKCNEIQMFTIGLIYARLSDSPAEKS